MKTLILFLFAFFASNLFCQEDYTLQGKVIDSLSGEILPYVSIYNYGSQKGSVSNSEGRFVLDGIKEGDSILFSFVGYEKKGFRYLIAKSDTTISLVPSSELMEAVTILADKSILYDLVSNLKKGHQNSGRSESKTYIELESFDENQQLELFQGYYNGKFRDYDITELSMKNARFGLAPIQKRIFASTDISKAIYKHKLIYKNEYFPTSPFELRKKELQKKYKLSLNKRYQNEAKHIVYCLEFQPRSNARSYFYGKVWIDSNQNKIIKTILKTENAKSYPFKPFWPEQSINSVQLSITKTFDQHSQNIQMKSLDFEYSLNYISEEDSLLKIHSKAILVAFDYENPFIETAFNFPLTTHSDFRRIQMLPYNESFWACTDQFKTVKLNPKREAFLKTKASINTFNLFHSDTIFDLHFFENPYVTWNGNRIILRGISADSSDYYKNNGYLLSERYNIEAQIFMDINEVCDSIQVITKTVFDPYTSFFHFETSKENQAFINIYFDIIEVERRKLDKEIQLNKQDPKIIQNLYNKTQESIQKISQTYFKETERGTNKRNLIKWNSYINKELGINNLKLFELE